MLSYESVLGPFGGGGQFQCQIHFIIKNMEQRMEIPDNLPFYQDVRNTLTLLVQQSNSFFEDPLHSLVRTLLLHLKEGMLHLQ